MYCVDIAQLLLKLGVPQYEPKVWRLFIDSSKRSLKCVLLTNGNQFASVSISHSTTLKEKCEAVKYVLEKISYDQWFICVDLKMVNFCWDNSLASPSTHVFCACGIVGTGLSITRRRTGLCGRNWCLAKKGTSSMTLWWTETEYSYHRCTSSSA